MQNKNIFLKNITEHADLSEKKGCVHTKTYKSTMPIAYLLLDRPFSFTITRQDMQLFVEHTFYEIIKTTIFESRPE